MLWDASFSTWQHFGVRINSQMMLVDADLATASSLFYGFGPTEQAQVLDSLETFS